VLPISVAKWYAAIVGVALVAAGLLGFLDNPIIADPSANPLFVTGTTHNLIHLLTGWTAIYIAFGLVGNQQAYGLIALGFTYLLILGLSIISPNLFGALGSAPTFDVNPLDHVLHAGLAIASIAIGWLTRIRGDVPAPTR